MPFAVGGFSFKNKLVFEWFYFAYYLLIFITVICLICSDIYLDQDGFCLDFFQ